MNIKNKKVSVAHIITGLNQGGAEKLLYDLVRLRDKNKFNYHIISLSSKGYYGKKFEEIGIPIYCLNMNFKNFPKILFQFFKEYKRQHRPRPDIIHSWMYHANLFGSILSKLINVPIIWSIHHASPFNNSLKTKFIVILNIIVSYLSPTRIVYCSNYAYKTHSPIGFKKKIQSIICNGIDTDYFACDNNLGNKEKIRIGFVGRWDPIKNHKLFIKVVSDLLNEDNNLEIMMAGQQINDKNEDLLESLNENAVKEKIKLLGECDDIVSFFCNLDILVSCSFEESFGLVIAEAMACGTLCVVTDTGMSSTIVGNTGIVVPINDRKSLRNGILKLIRLDERKKIELSSLARKRILEMFDIDKMTTDYQNLYIEILSK
tara:strand:+ start:208 stop:1329 length:1122 start_codon:yes stop_codon:yes gene_type:complete